MRKGREKKKRENGIGAAHSEKFTKVDAYDHHHLFVHKTVSKNMKQLNLKIDRKT